MTDAAVDAELVEVAFDARATVGPERFARLMERYRADSVAAVTDLPGVAGVVYDVASGERLDVWGPGSADAPRPVFVFVHGGYWRALSRGESAFGARMLAEHGVATVVPDYTLAPGATLEEITRQVRAAIAWVYHEGPRHGLDRSRVVVGGSSAGGHLAAMTMVDGWQAEFGLPEDVVAAGFPISGTRARRGAATRRPGGADSVTAVTKSAGTRSPVTQSASRSRRAHSRRSRSRRVDVFGYRPGRDAEPRATACVLKARMRAVSCEARQTKPQAIGGASEKGM
ncbi:alpha/beta hydrolase [Embleya sp. NPDC005575]|uniref:alpha/beta hydrolase n=1 Tax=Embleya sp. NPDC005575 TaxID=3156892 RepID=UPI0033B3EACC